MILKCKDCVRQQGTNHQNKLYLFIFFSSLLGNEGEGVKSLNFNNYFNNYKVNSLRPIKHFFRYSNNFQPKIQDTNICLALKFRNAAPAKEEFCTSRTQDITSPNFQISQQHIALDTLVRGSGEGALPPVAPDTLFWLG